MTSVYVSSIWSNTDPTIPQHATRWLWFWLTYHPPMICRNTEFQYNIFYKRQLEILNFNRVYSINASISKPRKQGRQQTRLRAMFGDNKIASLRLFVSYFATKNYRCLSSIRALIYYKYVFTGLTKQIATGKTRRSIYSEQRNIFL